MFVDPLPGLLDPRADETEQHTSDDNDQREPDEGQPQSLKISHVNASPLLVCAVTTAH